MFKPVLRSQGTDEQIAKWMPLCDTFRIIGCYAQTELGHGSNLSGLETTATYIKETEEFEINSPTLTSSKFWIGGLGIIATHAMVVAQLYVNGKNYGPHPFIVPIRSLKDHSPLKGVIVGDIGPKFGFGAIDNGFVRFHRIRIPREHMLMRFANVSKDGVYSQPPHSKISYGGMVYVRAFLADESGINSARAAVVATRYCTVRRQFSGGDHPGETLENAVIMYPMVQYRLFPIIASSYVLLFAGKFVMNYYYEMEKDLQTGNVE
jgi:acyl-CoA oxidase